MDVAPGWYTTHRCYSPDRPTSRRSKNNRWSFPGLGAESHIGVGRLLAVGFYWET